VQRRRSPQPTPASKATLDKIGKMTAILDGKTLAGWNASVKGTNAADINKAWTVKVGARASPGEGRGVLYTEKEYGCFRLIFTMRHVDRAKEKPRSDQRASTWTR
jgi:hypothetical protein